MSTKISALIIGALVTAGSVGPAVAKDYTPAQREKLKADHTALVQAGKVEPCFGAALTRLMHRDDGFGLATVA